MAKHNLCKHQRSKSRQQRSQNLSFEILEAKIMLASDFGDAPFPYPVTLAEGGPQHTVVAGPRLGVAVVDTEADGTHSAAADFDDTHGSTPADEDGVTFGTIQVGALQQMVTVNVQGAAGELDAWIDFNRDGSWGGPGEQIFSSRNVGLGDSNLVFDVPTYALAGTTYARFRISTNGDLGIGGLAADGEVEDYQVTIAPSAESLTNFPGQTTISTDALGATSVFAADVDGDGDIDVLSALRVLEHLFGRRRQDCLVREHRQCRVHRSYDQHRPLRRPTRIRCRCGRRRRHRRPQRFPLRRQDRVVRKRRQRGFHSAHHQREFRWCQ